jgi:adenosylmethionine-8-amino-7-oxononanoate aminotransferase
MTNVIYPTTNFKATEQIVIERGEGIYVYDNQGKQYLEGLAGLWCTSLGYGNEELIEAATAQMRQLSYYHSFGGKTHPTMMALADKIRDMVPVENAKIFFGNSGSDANDTFIKILRYYSNAIGKPQKRKIITRERGYHGVTVASGALTSLPANLTHFDAPVEALGILRTEHPHYYKGRHPGESETAFVERIVASLETLILAEGPETIAAFLAEPITGASGVIVPPAGYYEKVQALLNKYDILFWADEVICGFGRTGNDFGCTTMNIEKPALMTLAKQLSSAYVPISASVVRGDIYEALVEPVSEVGVFGHGYTYSGHPLGCAVALKTLEIYERDNIFDKAARTGDYLQQKLAPLAEHPLVGEVRGRGLIAALELVSNKATGEGFPPSVAAYLTQACADAGLIGRPVAGTAFALCPPLIITETQIDELVEKLSIGLAATLDHVQREGLTRAA